MNRKEKERQQRIDFIVKTAKKIFSNVGYEKTSMDEVARKAEFSKTTLYKYFNSKDELFLIANLQGQKKRCIILQKIIDMKVDPVEKIEIVCREFYLFYKKNVFYLRLLIYWHYKSLDLSKMNNSVTEKYHECNDQSWRLVNIIFLELKESGQFNNKLDLEITANQFIFNLRSIIKESLETDKKFINKHGDNYFENYIISAMNSFIIKKK